MKSWRLTAHARRVLEERAIDERHVEKTLMEPQWTETDPLDSTLTRSFRSLPAYGGRVLRVVARIERHQFVVVTAFLDRGASRRSERG